MRVNWLLGALVTFIMGIVLSFTLIGALIGIPLIVLSIMILLIGFILPAKHIR